MERIILLLEVNKMKKIIGFFACWLIIILSYPALAGYDEAQKAYDSGDYLTAFKEFLPLAEQGDVEAQFKLGYMYDFALGMPQDLEKGEYWYQKAAENGHIVAMNNLAYSWSQRGIKLEEATKLMREVLAAYPNEASYIDTLGWIYYQQQDYEKAFTYICDAALKEPGAIEVREHLGDVYDQFGLFDQAIMEWQQVLDLEQNRQFLSDGASKDYLQMQNLKIWQQQLQNKITKAQALKQQGVRATKELSCLKPIS